MPYPKKRREPPKPNSIRVWRHDTESTDTVPAAKFRSYQAARAIEPVFDTGQDAEVKDFQWIQTRMGLKRGDLVHWTITPKHPLWCLVHAVNGPEHTVTARTVIFDRPAEHTIPFKHVEPWTPTSPWEHSAVYMFRLQVAHRFESRRYAQDDPEEEAA